MDKSKKIFYENVLPAKNGKTTNVQFKDHNDLVIEEKRNDVNFAKKLNNFLFSCISCFFVFIIVSLFTIYILVMTQKKDGIQKTFMLIEGKF